MPALRPRIHFEEQDESMIAGIGWRPESIDAGGGIEVSPEQATRKNAKDPILRAEQVIAARPNFIIGSRCGKKFVPAKLAARPGLAQVPAVDCAKSNGADPAEEAGSAHRWARCAGRHRH